MIKKVLAGALAIAVSILIIRLAFFLLGVVFHLVMFALFVGIVLALAIPLYLYIRKEFIK